MSRDNKENSLQDSLASILVYMIFKGLNVSIHVFISVSHCSIIVYIMSLAPFSFKSADNIRFPETLNSKIIAYRNSSIKLVRNCAVGPERIALIIFKVGFTICHYQQGSTHMTITAKYAVQAAATVVAGCAPAR